MKALAYYDGKIGAPEELTVPFYDRANFFGDGCYDAAMAANGTIFLLEPTRLQSSTRYINYAGRGFDYIIPPSIQNNKEALEKYQALMAHINEECRALQEDYGIPKEDVANGLPLGMTASIVDKRNLRSLTEMSHQRMCNRAYWEYRQLFGDIRKALSEYSEEWRWIADNLFMPKCDYFGYCSETRPCGKPVSGVPKMPRP